MLVMAGGYALALSSAHRLPGRWVVASIVAAHANRPAGPAAAADRCLQLRQLREARGDPPPEPLRPILSGGAARCHLSLRDLALPGHALRAAVHARHLSARATGAPGRDMDPEGQHRPGQPRVRGPRGRLRPPPRPPAGVLRARPWAEPPPDRLRRRRRAQRLPHDARAARGPALAVCRAGRSPAAPRRSPRSASSWRRPRWRSSYS